MSARPIGDLVAVFMARAGNFAALNDFLLQIDNPSLRKRAVMATWEAELISDTAAELLLEHHHLEAA